MHLTDALNEAWVESHVVGVLCQNRLQLLCQRIHLVVGFSRHQIEKYSRDTSQQVVVALFVFIAGDDGVVESGLLWIIDDFVNLLVVTAYSFHECLFVVFKSDFIEGHSIVWSIVGY